MITATGQTFTVRMRLFGVPYVIRNRVVEFEADRQDRLAALHRQPLALRARRPRRTAARRSTESFDTSRADGVTDAVVRWAKFYERNREGIVATLERLKKAAEADAL